METQINTGIRIGVGIGIVMGKSIWLVIQLELKRNRDSQCIWSYGIESIGSLAYSLSCKTVTDFMPLIKMWKVP